MTYEDWEKEVALSFAGEPLWKVTAYRKSLFLGDLAWKDVMRLVSDRRAISLADHHASRITHYAFPRSLPTPKKPL